MENAVLERFKLLEHIGEGTFSHVYKVREKATGFHFAAKRLNDPFIDLDSAEQCIEIRALKMYGQHPNIVGIVDFVYAADTGNLTLIFPLMDMNMYEFLKKQKRCLSEMRARNILYQIIKGLEHLHKNGIIHRDIKPENILVKTSRNLRSSLNTTELIQLADFGSVCNTKRQQPYSTYISTRWYRAPECILTGGYYSTKMDIWAVGCVFYEILTMNPLFPGENELDQLYKIHEVLGSPAVWLLKQFKHRNLDVEFPLRKPIPIRCLLPMVSNYGIDVLTKTLIYHPNTRANIQKLVDHIYFNDIKPHYCSRARIFTSTQSLDCDKHSEISSQSLESFDEFFNSKSNHQDQKRSLSSVFSKNSSLSGRSLRSETLYSQTSLNKREPHVLKQMERVWGMNPGRKKTDIEQTIKRMSNHKYSNS